MLKKRGGQVLLVLLALLAASSATAGSTPPPPPRGAAVDYQLGGDYRVPAGTRIVARDWFSGKAPKRIYAICYVNAFQTQAEERGVARPDEHGAWPAELVLDQLPDDPDWPGEALIDLSTSPKRAAAAAWIKPMLRVCRDKGFEAVEFDNLDSWTRFQGTAHAGLVPFGRSQALDYARRLTAIAHRFGLAVAQKNTPQLTRHQSRSLVGFDFAVAEECARWHECGRYRALFGRRVIIIEYRSIDLARACRRHRGEVSVVRRDRGLATPRSSSYRYARCR